VTYPCRKNARLSARCARLVLYSYPVHITEDTHTHSLSRSLFRVSTVTSHATSLVWLLLSRAFLRAAGAAVWAVARNSKANQGRSFDTSVVFYLKHTHLRVAKRRVARVVRAVFAFAAVVRSRKRDSVQFAQESLVRYEREHTFWAPSQKFEQQMRTAPQRVIVLHVIWVEDVAAIARGVLLRDRVEADARKPGAARRAHKLRSTSWL